MEEKPGRGPRQERRLWWSGSGGHSRLAREVGPHPVFQISPQPTSHSAPGASPSWPPLEHRAGRRVPDLPRSRTPLE
jgi:hypothetical protein